MELITQILKEVLSPAILLVALAFIVRKVFERALDRDIVQFRSELEKTLFEHQTRFSLLHQRRGEVSSEVYRLLVNACDRLDALVHIMQPSGQDLLGKKEATLAAVDEFRRYSREHMIFLTQDIVQRIENVQSSMDEVLAAFIVGQPGESYQRDSTGLWEKAWGKVNTDLPPLKWQLEHSLRSVLYPQTEQSLPSN
ncbi:MAG: hypothetical protein AB1752_06265 [Candidatus Zixiibacteriota bacterium]